MGRTPAESRGGTKIKNKSWPQRGDPNGKEVEKEGEKRSSGPSQDRRGRRGRRRRKRRGENKKKERKREREREKKKSNVDE